MYSVYYDNARHTLNTFLRRPIKKAFTSNSKKLVITVDKKMDWTLESAYPHIRTDEDWRANTETVLSQAVRKFLERGPPVGFIGSFKKSGIIKRN